MRVYLSDYTAMLKLGIEYLRECELAACDEVKFERDGKRLSVDMCVSI